MLAAAVCGRAELIVTQNTRDFPAGAADPFDIEAVDQDTFLLDQFDLGDRIHAVITRLDRLDLATLWRLTNLRTRSSTAC